MKNDFPRIEIPPQLRHRMTEIACEFRKEPTESEKILWQALRGKKLNGIKFRRQQPVGFFVVDFYNSAYRLAIEVDGPIHENQREADLARQEILETLGLIVLRIDAVMVERNLSAALEVIRSKISELKSQKSVAPSPILGEGWGGGE